MSALIRAAGRDDAPAIRRLVAAAFGRLAEADLVERLRAEGAVAVELVAVAGAAVVGHVLFSRLAVEPPGRAVLALAPLAVAAPQRRRGFGARLVDGGLARARAERADAVIVLGDPAYYQRFGFSAAAAEDVAAPFAGPGFMALALRPGALAGRTTIRYPAAFGV